MKHAEPITQAEREGWNSLIKKTKTIVKSRDKSQFDLILLAGQVDTKYGENRIGKWADECGLEYSQAKQFRWLHNKGVDSDFIKKWHTTGKLSYSVIRSVIGFAGSAKSPYALEYLQWAVDHSASVIAVRAYMLEVTAPQNGKEQALSDIKIALRDKQDHEGFSDYVLHALEGIVEAHPEAEAQIMRTVIVDSGDLEDLKLAAGVTTAEEEKVVDDAAAAIKKVKVLRKWLLENEQKLTSSIATGHELSHDLKHSLSMLGEMSSRLAETEVNPVSIPAEFIVESEIIL